MSAVVGHRSRAVALHTVGGETFGPEPYLGAGQHRPIDVFNATPDYVSVLAGGSDVVVGYVKKMDMMIKVGDTYVMSGAGSILPVYADGGSPLVGHLYPGSGFVPLGENPPNAPRTISVTAR